MGLLRPNVLMVIFLCGAAYPRQGNLRPDKGRIEVVLSHQNLAVRTGHTLRINCTVLRRNESLDATPKVTWKKVGKALNVESRLIDNYTRQMELLNVRASDSGRYRCAIKSADGVTVHSKYADVLVGDLPSSPKNLRSFSLNWKMCFKWSPSATGGLPTKYKIKYRCLADCELDDEDNTIKGWHVACKSTPHTPGGDLSCCLDHVTLFVRYQAVVVARNAVGSTTSQPIEFQRGIETTLSPPSSLRGEASGYGEIIVSWTPGIPRVESLAWSIKYIVNFHADGETRNQSVVANTGQNRVRLADLRPYTRYTIYVGAEGEISGKYAIPAGPITVYTNEENPSDAPEITEFASVACPDNHQIRNVIIKWKLPYRHTWNGIIRRFIIEYRRARTYYKQDALPSRWGKILHVNGSSSRRAVITGLQCHDRYEVEMKMCNTAGCSGISNRVTIHAAASPTIGTEYSYESSSLSKWVVLVAIIIAGMLFVFAIIVAVILRKRFKQDASNPKIVMRSCYPMKSTPPYKRMEGESV